MCLGRYWSRIEDVGGGWGGTQRDAAELYLEGTCVHSGREFPWPWWQSGLLKWARHDGHFQSSERLSSITLSGEALSLRKHNCRPSS